MERVLIRFIITNRIDTMTEKSESNEVKNPKQLLLEILRVLTYFYSFRELEKKLGYPMQTLWKYHTLRTIPEKETALKILKRIKESKIIDEIILEISSNISDIYELLSTTGILELASFDAIDIIKQHNINTIISMPDSYAAALATLISSRIRVSSCITDRYYIPSNSICTVLKLQNNTCVPLCISRVCLNKKSRIMLVESVYENKTINQISLFLNKYGARIQAAYIVYGNREEVHNDVLRIDGEKPVLRLLIEKHIIQKAREHRERRPSKFLY